MRMDWETEEKTNMRRERDIKSLKKAELVTGDVVLCVGGKKGVR